MSKKPNRTTSQDKLIRQAASSIDKVLDEPILKILLENSVLTRVQLETFLIDLVIEDSSRIRIPYQEKALYRSRTHAKKKGISRGAYNRTLNQARRNTTKCLHTMLLLAYLGLFDFAVFRPFEEVASRIGDYRLVREVLAGRSELSSEDIESYRSAEETIVAALEDLSSPLIMKPEYKGSLKD
jgi:hypothetical protein